MKKGSGLVCSNSWYSCYRNCSTELIRKVGEKGAEALSKK